MNQKKPKIIPFENQIRTNQKNFIWNTVSRSVYQKDLTEAYEQVLYWRKNIFMLLTRNAD